jgi:phytoene/squalene synthetase
MENKRNRPFDEKTAEHTQISASPLAASLTRSASKQTFYTIRFLADHELIQDAYRAYAYFRWVDDQLDQSSMKNSDRMAFVKRQAALIERSYRGEHPRPLSDEEGMLVDLIAADQEPDSGLQAYIRNMHSVMAFDAERRGRLITEEELNRYTYHLAAAVTEAMHHFIGHGCQSPQGEGRYLAVSAAHITHMLRDTLEDVEAGYYNIPREYIEPYRIDPRDVQSEPYRKWVEGRIELARLYFNSGMEYLARVENIRCRLAGYAYTARFTGVLNAIEREGYRVRSGYPECKGLSSVMSMIWLAFSQAINDRPLVDFFQA